jgi:hypothetical protein
MKRVAADTAHRRPANQSAGRPFGPRNGIQRVLDRACVICGGPVVRAARGPAPRACTGCGSHIRAVRQLRAYFASAERLAQSLDRASVAALAREAVADLDGEGRR